jgi:SNF2 family DNA or RNA helicase
MHERQWNPANEEQCEGRFSRIGSTKTSILVKYMVAIGTIDEWFTELVDTKRKHLTSLLDMKEASMDETSLTREMMDIIYNQGRKKWSLR